MKILPPAKEERLYLKYLVYTYARLSSVYYLQAMSIWIRLKPFTDFHQYRLCLAVCLNIAVHFLGPQSTCKHVPIFRPGSGLVFTQKEFKELYTKLLGYTPAYHLKMWHLAKNIQWHVILHTLRGRIQ